MLEKAAGVNWVGMQKSREGIGEVVARCAGATRGACRTLRGRVPQVGLARADQNTAGPVRLSGVESPLVLKQLLAGRDFAVGDTTAGSMQNFAYLIGDRRLGECLVVDPAWDVKGLVDAAAAEGLKIVGALVTHYHPDHVGGTMFGFTVEGLPTLMEINPCKVHVHRKEAHGVRVVTGISKSDMIEHDSGDIVEIGDVEVELLHTPGHTPGSQCFRLRSALVAGDTLFLQGCGRVDLPGGDPDEMYETLTRRLASLPDDMVLLPGHAYGGEKAPLGVVRRNNPYLQIKDLETWRRHMG